MKLSGSPPEIFDRQRRRALRQRASRRNSDRFLFKYVADELTERLAMVSRNFERALFIGPMSDFASTILGARHCAIVNACLNENAAEETVVAEEDRLPFDLESFDLVIAAGTLDSVNDLPGALVQVRRTLRPDGLFLGHMFGAGSLATLKSLLMAADGDVATPHIHPQIELRSAADLLSRAGFKLPVADSDTMTVRYRDWRSIVTDLRDAGIGNALAGRARYAGKDLFSRLDADWGRRAGNSGKLDECYNHLFLSGWAPSPEQPQPAKRGSGNISLASVLGPIKSI